MHRPQSVKAGSGTGVKKWNGRKDFFLLHSIRFSLSLQISKSMQKKNQFPLLGQALEGGALGPINRCHVTLAQGTAGEVRNLNR